jgi:hypothetical protein
MECAAASWFPRWNDESGVSTRGYLVDRRSPYGRSDVVPEIRDMSAARTGTEAHGAKERGELRPDLWTGLDPLGSHEVCFSYCCKTGRVGSLTVLPGPLADRRRALWKALQCEHAVTGTADWWGQLGGRQWVDDLKTGWRVPEVLTPQLLFYALCVRDLTGVQDDVVLSITHWPRCKGEPTREGLWARVGGLALEGFRFELEAAWRRAVNTRDPQPGPHCEYCPSAAWCPAASG